MAHLSEIGECFICHKTFSFHPDRAEGPHRCLPQTYLPGVC
jgi:hypothetical protein